VVIRLVAVVAALPGVCGVALGQTSTALDLEFGGSVYHVEAAHHRGYSAVRWSRIPAALTPRSFQGRGTATAIVDGAPLELRVGSPFGRHGTTVFQLANAPYAEGGEVWVPLELFTDWLAEERAMGAPPPAAGETSTDPVAPAADYRKPGPWRVVIDAGHGGHDPGTISPRTGVREKDITLAVALKVAAELEARGGFQPLLTRSRDEFVKVMDRPSMAVALHADLFISIHVDAQPGGRSSASGFTTFYLGQARTDDALQVALRENAVIELEEGSEPPNIAQLEMVLATMDRDAYRAESSLLAGFIQNSLRGVVDTRDRGAKPGPYYVLLTPGLRPAILVELGFITHPGDERRLTSEVAQNRIARALADTIDRYLTEAGRRIATMEGRG
jgi:N-acetylmuramoyl-L-alanine amidase